MNFVLFDEGTHVHESGPVVNVLVDEFFYQEWNGSVIEIVDGFTP